MTSNVATTVPAPQSASPTGRSLSASLYVGDLPIDLSNPEDALFNLFSKVGMVVSIKVCRDINTHRSLGYAYVNFQNPQDAQTAINQLNFSEIKQGKPIRIMWSQRDPLSRKNTQNNIFVKNLPTSTDARKLHETFAVIGNILSSKLCMDVNGNSLGYGFVNFDRPEDAEEAIKRLDGMDVGGGQKLSVAHFKRRTERQQEQEAVFTRVYIKNIAAEVTEDSLKTHLVEGYGAIDEIFVGGTSQHATKYAIVNFVEHQAAIKFIEESHNKVIAKLSIADTSLYASRHLKKSERQAIKSTNAITNLYQNQGRNVYIKHLDDNITEKELSELFRSYGEVTSCVVMRDAQGVSRGFGFVCFGAKESATQAIREMNGKIIYKRPLYVSQAQQRDQRHAMLEDHRKSMLVNQQRITTQQFGGMYPNPPSAYNNSWNNPGHRGVGGFPMMFPPGPLPHFAGKAPMMQPMMRGPMMNRGPMPQFVKTAPQFQNRYPHQGGPMVPNAINNQQQTTVSGISSQDLSKMSAEELKNTLGERLYVKIQEINPSQAAKITGMLLEMDVTEIVNVLEDSTTLVSKVKEAESVLRQHTTE